MADTDSKFEWIKLAKDFLQIVVTGVIGIVAIQVSRASYHTQSLEIQIKLSNELLEAKNDQGKALAIIRTAHTSRKSASDSPDDWVLMKETLFQVLDDRAVPFEIRKAANLEFNSYLDIKFPRNIQVQVFAHPDDKSQKFRTEMIELWQKEISDCSFVSMTGPENDGIWDVNDFHFGIDYDLLKDQEIGRQFAAMANLLLPNRSDFLFLEQFPYIGGKRDSDIRVFINAHMFEHAREQTEQAEAKGKAILGWLEKHPKEAHRISEKQSARHNQDLR